jgi:hypothetical protein
LSTCEAESDCQNNIKRSCTLNESASAKGIDASVAAVLADQGWIVATPVGNSMWPLLKRQRNAVLIRQAAGRLRRHDIALFRRDNGQLVLHRVMEVGYQDYACCGDNQLTWEHGIREDQILGLVEGFYRGESFISCTDPGYQRYVRLWCSSMGLRRICLQGAMVMRKTAVILHRPARPVEPACTQTANPRSTATAYLLQLVAAVLHRQSPPLPTRSLDWAILTVLVEAHHLERLVDQAIRSGEAADPQFESCVPAEARRKLRQLANSNLRRFIRQDYEISRLQASFEAQAIDYLPLKGLVLQYCYPAPGLRYMTDADILIRSGQLERAVRAVQALGYTMASDSPHHVMLHQGPSLTLELHHTLLSGQIGHKLGNVWDRAKPDGQSNHGYQLAPEDFTAYLLAHMAKHFSHGGIGIRSLIDIQVTRQHFQDNWNEQSLQRKLQDLGLREFSSRLQALANDWFGENPAFNQDDELSQFIISSAMIGTCEQATLQSVAAQGKHRQLVQARQQNIKQNRQNNLLQDKLRWCISRVFPSTSELAITYPWLTGWPWLLPIAWLARAGSIVWQRPQNLRLLFWIWQIKPQAVHRIHKLAAQLNLHDLDLQA